MRENRAHDREGSLWGGMGSHKEKVSLSSGSTLSMQLFLIHAPNSSSMSIFFFLLYSLPQGCRVAILHS